MEPFGPSESDDREYYAEDVRRLRRILAYALRRPESALPKDAVIIEDNGNVNISIRGPWEDSTGSGDREQTEDGTRPDQRGYCRMQTQYAILALNNASALFFDGSADRGLRYVYDAQVLLASIEEALTG